MATAASVLPAGRERSPAVSVRLATGDAALGLLDARWDDLTARQAVPNPTLSATWLRELAHWRTGLPLVAVAEAEGRLAAGAALELRGARRGARIATWLGPVEQHFSPDLLADPELPAAAESLVAAILDEVGVLSIGAPASGAAARALAVVAPWRRAAVTGERWLLPWPAPRLEYARSCVARDVRRAARRGVEVDVRVVSEPDEVERMLVRLFRIHRGRWRDRPEETPRFGTTRAHRLWNRRTVTAMAAGGHARGIELLEDGRLITGALGFVHGRGGIGHTQAFQAGGTLREPGHAGVLACLEALAAAGADGFDLGVSSGEAGGPKARLGAVADPIELILAAASPGRQRLYEGAYRLRRTVRTLGAAAPWRR